MAVDQGFCALSFQELMAYCANDVAATCEVFKVLWPEFNERLVVLLKKFREFRLNSSGIVQFYLKVSTVKIVASFRIVDFL